MLIPIAIGYIFLNILLIARYFNQWISIIAPFSKNKIVRIIFCVIYACIACSMLISYFLPSGQLKRFVTLLGNYWLGIALYLFLFTIIAVIIRNILKKNDSKKYRVISGFFVIGLTTIMSVYGIINASIIRTTTYNVSINKNANNIKNLTVALLADLHLGYNIDSNRLEKIVNATNEAKPDIVIIAGDIFDNEYEALDNPEKIASILKRIKSKYGTYAVLGNHDVKETLLAGFTISKDKKKLVDARNYNLIKEAGITLLKDETTLIDNSFYLVGRLDYAKPGNDSNTRMPVGELTKDLDKSKPVFLIDHEPKQLLDAQNAGVDVDLSGHTHDGQLFPGNILTYFLSENNYGLSSFGSFHSIVTSGAGLFGPNMRVGTKSEICKITINFSDN